MSKSQENEVFSDQLERWLRGKNHKTLASLIDAFEDKSFAIFFAFLMILPALPLPTGGLTHVLEIIVIVVAIEMIVGLKTIWLPERVRAIKLGESVKGRAVPMLIKRVKWFEKYSNPRGVRLFSLPVMPQVIGVFVLLFTVAAFVAPPFTGLDTLPSIGVVMMGLAMVLEDIYLLLAGMVVGVVGSVLVVGFGAVVFEGLTRFI